MSKKDFTSIYTFDNYRDFIVKRIDEMGYSQRAFAQRHHEIVSRVALAKLLARGKGAQKRTASYRMSPEKLGQLGKALGLKEKELTYFILLRLENDSDAISGRNGLACRRVYQTLLKELKKGRSSDKPSASPSTASPLFELMDILPSTRQKKVIREAVKQGSIQIGRMHGRPGRKQLTELVQKLEDK